MKNLITSLFVMLFCIGISMNVSAQEYVQNGGFEDNDPFGVLGASFYFNEVENWTSNSQANNTTYEYLCSNSPSTFPQEGSFFALVNKNTYIRNTLSKPIHPGQKLNISLLHKKLHCDGPFVLNFDISLHSQGNQSGFPAWSNPLLVNNTQSFGGGWQTLSVIKEVPVPIIPNGVDFCSYPEVDLFFPTPWNALESSESAQTDSELMGFDAFSITGCTQPSKDIIYTNMEDESNCATVNFTTECDLENTRWYHWEFGDGTKQSGATLHNPTHTYPDKGEYSVTLTRVNAEGCLEITTSEIDVACEDCRDIKLGFTIPEKECKVQYGWVQDPQTLQWQNLVVANVCQLTFNGLTPITQFGWIQSWNWTANGVPFSNLQNPTATFTTSSPLPEPWEFCVNIVNSDGCVAQQCQTITLPCFFQNNVESDGIFEEHLTLDLNSSTSDFSIFPNPAIDQITVSANWENNIEDWKISIHDLSGKLIRNESGVNSSSSLNQVINVSEIPPGTYIINLSTATQSTTEKLVIHRN